MATVYLARDLKLPRQVAVKVMRPEIAAALGTDRFLSEIRVVAPLNHPHILQLYDSGEADGVLYFVMPYVEGESLRDRLKRDGRMPTEEAVRLTGEIADALEYAHAHGIVHRDIKPENILLHAGHALVCDFGIAKAFDAATTGVGLQLTETGVAVGTPIYMSPEQATGDKLDGRTDIYSLGCLLYEMLEGLPPYTGPSAAAVIGQHVAAPVPPLKASRESAGGAVEAVIRRAMAKAPAERFATGGRMRAALSGDVTVPTPAAPRPRASIDRRMVGGAVAILGVLLGVGLWQRRGAAAPVGAEASIAVLPFRNESGDSANDPFSVGVSDEITTALGRVPGLQVSARTLVREFRRRSISTEEAGRQLKVRYVLDGGVRVGGTRRRVSVQLIDVSKGTEIWSDEYDKEAGDRDVFAVQDSIARAVVGALRIQLTPLTRAALASHSTQNPRAHDLYLRGRYLFDQRGGDNGLSLTGAVEAYSQAIALDSGYALAYAGRAQAYSLVPVFGREPPAGPFARAKADARRAVELDSTLADAHTALGAIAVFHDWDWPAAAREFRLALSLDSTDIPTHQFYAQYLAARGQYDSCIAELRTAQRLDPSNPISNIRLATALFYARRYSEAEVAYRLSITVNPNFPPGRAEYALLLAVQGRYDSAAALLIPRLDSVGLSLNGGWVMAAPAAYLFGKTGRRAEARRIEEFLERMRRRGEYVMPMAEAVAAIGREDTAAALGWLERGYRERSFLIYSIGAPVFDPLRGQPRFEEIVRGIGIVNSKGQVH